ncbi:MotA/TolQ/ExbB proton channel family protein [Romboutsia sp.]|uniref:MotA/TolQ/ExbB proton channel family protein n=1 Tax=Romboutsia sp. TaxID=1965302 RepID=UPI003F3EC55B
MILNTIIINSITVVFVVVTIAYSIANIILNKSLYNFIKKDYNKLNDDYKRSILYDSINKKYNRYVLENYYANINMTSFIEEVCTDFTFKNKGILERIKVVKNASATCILLGVLGTFVGLSVMLLNINTGDIIHSLPKAISAMQTAFITSICGIICSIIINFSTSRSDCEYTLVQLMLKLENLLTSDITHIKSLEFDSRVEDIKNTIKQISKSIESIESFDQISKDLNDFNDEFINGIEALKYLLYNSQDSIKSFEQNVSKLDKQFSILNVKFTKLFEKYEGQDDINKEILLDIKKTSRNIYESTENQYKIKDYIKNINASFGLYERNTEDLLTKLISHENKISRTQEELNNNKDTLSETVDTLANIITTSSEDISEKLEVLFKYIDIYREILNISVKNIEDLDLKEVEDKQIYNEEEIYEIEESQREKVLEINGDDFIDD